MLISVIIVNYNTKDLLKDCLDSLFSKNKGLEMQVVVVDNASKDDSVDMVKKDFPNVLLIENKENLGFAGGNNVGLRKTKGEYVLLLNSDTRFNEDSLEKMVEFMEKNPKVGISSCQLVWGDGRIQPSGGFFPNLWRVFAWMFFVDDLPWANRLMHSFHPHAPGFYTQDDWYEKQNFQDWVTGAFFFVRQQVLKDIGLLDENFFMYAEEMEFCYRAKKAGWQVAYVPVTSIVHLGGQSGSSRKALVGEYQGLNYFFAKHKPPWQMLFLKIFLKGGAVLRMILFGIMKRNREVQTTYEEAFRTA